MQGSRAAGAPRLTTAQVAARLGVKSETVYSYVSRGLLSSQPRQDDHPGSEFDPLEVEALARNRKRARGTLAGGSQPATMPGNPLLVIDWPLTLIRDDDLYYCGESAARLAGAHSFESVADWLWRNACADHADHVDHADETGQPRAGVEFSAPAAVLEAVHAAMRAAGSDSRLIDRLTLAVLTAGIRDPFKRDLRPEAVQTMAGTALAAMVAALERSSSSSSNSGPAGAAEVVSGRGSGVGGGKGTLRGTHGSVAAQLWRALADRAPAAEDIATLNAALVLVADHDLAASTLAARAAATARAHPYAALAAALSAFDSPLHGLASETAVALVAETMATGNPERAISAQLAAGHGIPGFGHRLYRACDPRAVELLRMLASNSACTGPVRAAQRLTAVVASRTPQLPNIDLALAVLTMGAGMAPDAGQAIFAVGRSAGWLAHVLDEYAQRPLRLRPSSRYTGALPG